MRLAEADARVVLEAATMLMGVGSPDEFEACAPAATRRVVGGDIVFYNELDLRRRRSRAIGDPQEACDATYDAWCRRMGDHPVIAYAARTGDLAPRRITDFLSRRAFRRTALFDEVYRPIGVDDQLGAPIHVSTGRVVGVAIARGKVAFADRERDRFEALRPFLTVAHRRAELELRTSPELAEAGLTRREHEVVELATRGWTNGEIAAALVISPRTVAKHLEHAYAKLGVHGRRAAARLLRRA